jgi:hypothetical protein
MELDREAKAQALGGAEAPVRAAKAEGVVKAEV